MSKFDNLSSANTLAQHATLDRDQLVVHLFTEMAQKISYLEQEISKLNDLTAGGLLNPFDERVLNVLDVRSGSARAALQLEDTDVQRWMLSAIEENSGEAFGHIEAEIEEKIDALLEGHAFAEAVTDAVQGSLHGIVEEILDGILADAITDHLGDAEDIVRKGLRSIL